MGYNEPKSKIRFFTNSSIFTPSTYSTLSTQSTIYTRNLISEVRIQKTDNRGQRLEVGIIKHRAEDMG